MAVIKLINENTRLESIDAAQTSIAKMEHAILRLNNRIKTSTNPLTVRDCRSGIACREESIGTLKKRIITLEKQIRRDR